MTVVVICYGAGAVRRTRVGAGIPFLLYFPLRPVRLGASEMGNQRVRVIAWDTVYSRVNEYTAEDFATPSRTDARLAVNRPFTLVGRVLLTGIPDRTGYERNDGTADLARYEIALAIWYGLNRVTAIGYMSGLSWRESTADLEMTESGCLPYAACREIARS